MSNFMIDFSVARIQQQSCQIPKHKKEPLVVITKSIYVHLYIIKISNKRKKKLTKSNYFSQRIYTNFYYLNSVAFGKKIGNIAFFPFVTEFSLHKSNQHYPPGSSTELPHLSYQRIKTEQMTDRRNGNTESIL